MFESKFFLEFILKDIENHKSCTVQPNQKPDRFLSIGFQLK